MPAKKPSAAQRERAESLRKLIREMGAGVRPAGAPAPTPREITDEGARKKLERVRKKGRT
ncbi:MAG: hypothetical protein ACXWG1_08690 [Usitatibacter sp.]